MDDTASGANNGASWESAYTDLQLALAQETCTEIWVVKGVYQAALPETWGAPAISFALKSGVAIYGGFSGGETQLNQRDWEANQTILSGDLEGDDDGFTNNIENTYHVVTGVDIDETAVLDGFIIRGGNASSSPCDNNCYGDQQQHPVGRWRRRNQPVLRFDAHHP